MSTKTRLANKTIWALEDITALCSRARKNWEKAMTRAENKLDPVIVASLAHLSNDLAQIESIARLARQGDYDQNRRDT